ncbi:MAG TPA: hypothetical protein VH678_12750 [Xanthobacteraceae bacterium]|jgi:hypothetical protein
MSKKKNEMRTEVSEKSKQAKVSKTSEVDFELPDEELEDVSGGADWTTTWTPTVATVTVTVGGGRAK